MERVNNLGELPLERTVIGEARLQYILVFGLILVLGCFLRMDQLGSRSIWFDEAFTWKLINGFGWGEMLVRAANDVHPPLYYAICRIWQFLAGDSLVVLRFPSVVFGLVTIALVMASARAAIPPDLKRFRNSTALWSGLIIALLPAHIRWSQELRMYALMAMLCVLSAALVWWHEFANNKSAKLRVAIVLCNTLLIYTHYYGSFFLASQAVFVLVSAWKNGHGFDRLFLERSLLLGLPLVGFVSWIPSLIHQVGLVREEYWIPQFSVQSILDTFPQLLLSERFCPRVPWILRLLLSAFCISTIATSYFYGNRFERYLTILIAGPFFIALLVSVMLAPVLWPRYLLGSMMLFPVLAVRRVYELLGNQSASLVLTLICMGLLVADYRQSREIAFRGGMQKIADVISARSETDVPVLVGRSFLLLEAEFAFSNIHEWRRVLISGNHKDVRFDGGLPLLRDEDFEDFGADETVGKTAWWIDSDAWESGYKHRFPKDWGPIGDELITAQNPHQAWGAIYCQRIRRLR